MSWQVLILGNSLLVAIGVLATRAIARKKYAANSSLVVSAGVSIFQYSTILLLLPFIGHIDTTNFGQYWPWFIGGGLAFALSHVFAYKLLSYLDAGISSVLSTMSVLFTILFAALVLHEELSVSQAVGSIVLLLAVCYGVLIARHSKHHTVSRPWLWGLIFAVLASLFYSIALVNEKFLIGHMDATTYIAFGWAGQTIVAQAIALKDIKKIEIFRRTNVLSLTVVAGVTRAFSGLMLVGSQIKSDNVALISVSSNFRLIVIVLLAAWILKERQRLNQKLLAAAISIIGLAIIFWK